MTDADLSDLPGWEQVGQELRKTYKLRDFRAAIAFVNSVAQIAEDAQHHPNIDIRWNRVTLALSTHSAHALTSRDFDVARQVEASYTAEHGWAVPRSSGPTDHYG